MSVNLPGGAAPADGLPVVAAVAGSTVQPYAACTWTTAGVKSPVSDPHGLVVVNEAAEVPASALGQFRLPLPYCVAAVEFAGTPAAGFTCGPVIGRKWLSDRATGLGVLAVLGDPPAGLSAEAGGAVKLCVVGRPAGREVEFVRPTATRTSGRYPGRLQLYDRDANTWAEPTDAVWLVHPNGGELPTEFTQGGGDLTAHRVPCVYRGPLAADGKPVFVALVAPGSLLFWECVEDAPVYYFDPQV